MSDSRAPVSRNRLLEARALYRSTGRKVVSTNGCFDLLHTGHVRFLSQAKSLGDVLVVALNSDASVRRLKGEGRPVVPEAERAEMLLSLRWVDHVILFDDLLPTALLAELQPDIHCKAGDYIPGSLPEADAVRASGGEVRILPLVPGISTTRLLERACSAMGAGAGVRLPGAGVDEEIITELLSGANVLRQTAYRLCEPIARAAAIISEAVKSGRKILLCGNGGSAAMAQHLAAEMVGRFRQEREPWPAVALTADTAVMTAVGNDYGFEEIFVRQVAALGARGDVLVAMSTSGASRNILRAVETARDGGLFTIGLTRSTPNPLATSVDLSLCVPAEETSHLQQAHLALLHVISGLVERMLSDTASQSVKKA